MSGSAPASVASAWELRLTLAGRTLAILAALLLLPAFYDPLFFTLPLLLACVAVLQLLLGRANLAAVVPQAPAPATAFAGQPFLLAVELRHGSRRISARDLLLFQGLQRPRLAAYLAVLPPGANRALTLRWALPRRGRHRQYGLTLASSFPFGLCEWRRSFVLPADFLALPRLGEFHGLDDAFLAGGRLHGGEPARRAGEEEFHSLRLWRPGMSQRLVHWKVSAKQRELVLQDFQGARRRCVHLLLSCRPGGGAAQPRASFERAVSLCATLAERFLRQNFHLKLTLLGSGARSLDLGSGRRALYAALHALAEVQALPDAAPAGAAPLPWIAPRERGILILAGGPIPEARGFAGPIFDVDDPSLARRFRLGGNFSARLALRPRLAAS